MPCTRITADERERIALGLEMNKSQQEIADDGAVSPMLSLLGAMSFWRAGHSFAESMTTILGGPASRPGQLLATGGPWIRSQPIDLRDNLSSVLLRQDFDFLRGRRFDE